MVQSDPVEAVLTERVKVRLAGGPAGVLGLFDPWIAEDVDRPLLYPSVLLDAATAAARSVDESLVIAGRCRPIGSRPFGPLKRPDVGLALNL